MDRFLAKLSSYDAGTKLFELQAKGTDTDEGSEILRLFQTGHAADLSFAAGDRLIDTRCADDTVIIDDGNLLAYICGGCIGKFLFAIVGQSQAYHIFTRTSGLVGDRAAFGIRNVRTLDDNGTCLFDLVHGAA